MPTDDAIDDARMHSLRISSEDTVAARAARTSNDEVESDQSGHAARPALNHDQLSSEDYVELTRISHKKDDIERHIADLQSWSAWDPFEDVASYSTEPQVLLASNSALGRLSSELELRQGRCDRLEHDVQRFNVDDMKRLRKVAKATSKRHLSGPDTDLLELALSTIYALDKLLRLLRDQRAEHELTELRLRWERALLASWQDVAALRSDIQAFVRKCRGLKEALLHSPRRPHDGRSAASKQRDPQCGRNPDYFEPGCSRICSTPPVRGRKAHRSAYARSQAGSRVCQVRVVTPRPPRQELRCGKGPLCRKAAGSPHRSQAGAREAIGRAGEVGGRLDAASGDRSGSCEHSDSAREKDLRTSTRLVLDNRSERQASPFNL
ncbi:hypothetical protein L1887_48462 [Cichorium endivia]|nr:hypothetical protein L1887_48462 [Cichorium endivia]